MAGAQHTQETDRKGGREARNNTIGAYYRLGNRISDYHAARAEIAGHFIHVDDGSRR